MHSSLCPAIRSPVWEGCSIHQSGNQVGKFQKVGVLDRAEGQLAKTNANGLKALDNDFRNAQGETG